MSNRFPGRRLSWLRLFIAAIAFVLVGAVAASGFRTVKDERAAGGKSWFAGYADATITPRFGFETPVSKSARDVVLSFVVAGKKQRCEPSWGAAYTLDEAQASLDLDRRIARLRQNKGSIIVSFGGQANTELAAACTDERQLKKAYQAVIDRYEITTVDLDIEGPALADVAANKRRAKVLQEIQTERRAQKKELAVWLTVPVSTTGLTPVGTSFVTDTLASKLEVAGVNAMTMNFGESKPRKQSMSDASIDALKATHNQLSILFRQANEPLGPATLWKRMGATPMLGQNDTAGEIFTLADARKLNTFALDRGLGRMSVWSLNRDKSCGTNYADTTRVSNACSGVAQGKETFAAVLGKKFTGIPDRAGAGPVLVEATSPTTPVIDDPASSPYEIWNAGKAYLKDTKVVWKGNVYTAKYWTRGDAPDNPVLQAYETPWTLIGPVLPGEKPVPIAKVAAGTYGEWRPGRVYTRGKRVMADGIVFEAKWWTQGDDPLADTSDSDSSPWARLTDEQVRQVNEERK